MFSLASPIVGDPRRSPLIRNVPSASTILLENSQQQHQQQERELYVTQQDGLNVELETAVHDSCGAANALLEDFNTVSAGWKRQWINWLKSNSAAVDEFSSKMVYECKKPLSGTDLDAKVEVTLPCDWLQRWQDVMGTPMPSECRYASFKELHTELLHNTFEPLEKRDAAVSVEAYTRKYLHQNTYDLSALTIQSHENTHGNPLCLLQAELAKSEQLLGSAEEQITSLQDERTALVNKQATKEVEEKTDTIINTLDEVVRIVYSRFHQSRLAAVDVEEFEESVSQVAASTAEATSSAKKDIGDVRRSTEADIKRLGEFRKKHEEENESSRSRFRDAGEVFKGDLQRNSDEESDCWSIIQQQLTRLESLHGERVRTVGGWMLSVERDREREFKFHEMNAALEDRQRVLSQLLTFTADAIAYVNSISNLSNSAGTRVKRNEFPTQLLNIQKKEGARFAEAYKKHSLFASRILFTKEQRLENVRRLARATEFQVQTAAETLDVDAPKYKIQLRELRGTEESLRGATEYLGQQMELGAPLWDEIDGFLDSVDVDVEDVPLLVQELRRDLLKNHLAAVNSAVNGEQRLLDHEKAHVRKIANACSAAKDAIDGRRAERSLRHNNTISATAAAANPQSPQRVVAAGGGASAARAGRLA